MTMWPSTSSGATGRQEFDAGEDQVLVVYQPGDVGMEIDPGAIFSVVAADAADRARNGLRLVTMTSMSLRHAGTAFGNDGSGYETKVAVGVVYARSRATSS
jgi:hypothetical protein